MGEVKLPNPHLPSSENQVTFHLGVPLNQDIAAKFADVKFVCVGGTRSRMRDTCLAAGKQIYGKDITRNEEFDYWFENERYSGYKIGAVLCVNHGIGQPSLSIVLHEIFLLLQHSKCKDVTVFRIGTSGGLANQVGTVVITDKALDVDMKPFYHTANFGEALALEAKCDPTLLKELEDFTKTDQCKCDCGIIVANTYCANDFYQGQARMDGAFCDKTKKDKEKFLSRLHAHGVRNIEMESAGVLAFSKLVGIKAAVVCATLVDRYVSDYVTVTEQEVKKFIDAPIQIVVQFMKSKLQQS